MIHRHLSAIGVALSLIGSGPAVSQDLSLTAEELQSFLAANQGIGSDELAERLKTLNDAALDAQRDRSRTGYSHTVQPDLVMRSVRIRATAPASKPEPLRLGQGVISAVSFVDEEFRPLAIRSVVHDPGLFSINGEGCTDGSRGGDRQIQGNTLNIFPCQFWVQGTVNVMLDGMAQPVIFSAAAGSTEATPQVDAMVTVEVDDRTTNLVPNYASRRLTINPVDRTNSGVTPIYPGLGVITDVAFIDDAGNPWPIDEVVFQPSLVSVGGSTCVADDQQGGQSGKGTSNVMYLSLCRDRTSNLSVKLQGAPAALGLLLVSPGTVQRDFSSETPNRDVTITVTVPGRSPSAIANATAPASALPGSNVDQTGFQPDRFLTDFANGTPPRGARFVQMLGAPNIEGYIYNGQLYIRGRYRPINPTADASASSSSGGINVWRYNRPVNSLIVSDAQSGQEFSLTADF